MGWRRESTKAEIHSVTRVIGSDNGAARVIRFVNFREKIRGWGCGD
jgi:hypothetical protein